MKSTFPLVLMCGLFCMTEQVVALPPADATSPAASGVFHELKEFGPTTPAEAQATYDKAIETLRATGGVLVLPTEVWGKFKPQSLQNLVRIPEAPAPARTWRSSPGITVIAAGDKQVVIQVPPLDGIKLERDLRLPEGESLPHWGTHPMLLLENNLVYGSISYLEWLQEPVKKGSDRRFYVPTVRGLRPGQFLNIHGGPNYGGGVTRAYVKSLGFDVSKQLHYLVADTEIDHLAGAIVHNKSNTGLLHMLQNSNNDNQTYDVKVIRNQYAHGDTYVYYCDFNYMSNVHSAAGDENGQCYSAFVRSLDNNFRGAIESVDWDKQQVLFSASAQNIHTLGDSRPLINLNPKKHLTAGKVIIVPAECYREPTDTGKFCFEGKNYPTRLVKNPRTGVSELKVGGLIRGDKDSPWTEEVVGRFFAVATPEEMTPKGNYRWYQITAFRQNDDGTKEIEIMRHWWGAKSAGSPTLYREDSYTWEGHLRPLDYIIAPGTYVNDVSRALPGGDRGGQRILGVAPYADQGKPFDFEPGDPVEQAIGPDPFKPQIFRSWMWEDVPGPFPSAVFDIRNSGAATRHSAMRLTGGGLTLDKIMESKMQKPAWDHFFDFQTAAGVGLNFQGHVTDAALKFHQPSGAQAIKWLYGREAGKPPQEAVLTVSPQTGEFHFEGSGIRAHGPVSQVAGISGDATPAKNLRGKNVAVKTAAKSIRITFATPETDGDYAVFIEQTWLSQRAISDKGPDGFTVTFSEGAPADATLDWMIVR